MSDIMKQMAAKHAASYGGQVPLSQLIQVTSDVNEAAVEDKNKKTKKKGVPARGRGPAY